MLLLRRNEKTLIKTISIRLSTVIFIYLFTPEFKSYKLQNNRDGVGSWHVLFLFEIVLRTLTYIYYMFYHLVLSYCWNLATTNELTLQLYN